MITILRESEEVTLYDNIFQIEEVESKAVIDYLSKEFNKEAMEYPFTSPAFSESASLWGAKTVYLVAQLILYRKNRPDELQNLIENFQEEITPSTILSADSLVVTKPLDPWAILRKTPGSISFTIGILSFVVVLIPTL